MNDLLLLALSSFTTAWQPLARQDNVTTTSSQAPQTSIDAQSASSSANGSTSATALTTPPCCWIIFSGDNPEFGEQGVGNHWWYSRSYEQITATVITTYLLYGNSSKVANSSTKFIPQSDIFTSFGTFTDEGLTVGLGAVPSLPGIPTNLISQAGYAASAIYRANETIGRDSIASPTPYQIWPTIGLLTGTPYTSNTLGNHDPAMCGTYIGVPVNTIISGQATTATSTFLFPDNSTDDSQYEVDVVGFYIPNYDLYNLSYPYPVYTDILEAPFLGPATIAPPAPAVQSFTKNSSVLSAIPWVTNCYVLPAPGEPTVHIAVNQLTTNSAVYITMPLPSPTPGPSVEHNTLSPSDGFLTPVAAQPTSSLVVQPTRLSDELPQPSDAQSDQLPLPSTALQSQKQSAAAASPASPQNIPAGFPNNPSNDEPVPAETPVPTPASPQSSPANIPGSPSDDEPASANTPAPASVAQVLGDGSRASAAADGVITYGSRVYTASLVTPAPQSEPTAVVIDSSITIGPGELQTVNGATFSIASGNVVVASGGSIVTQAITAPGGSISYGSTVYGVAPVRPNAATSQSAIVIDSSVTLLPGSATTLDGATYSFNGNSIIFASGTMTTTQSLSSGSSAAVVTLAGSAHTLAPTVIPGSDTAGVVVLDGSITIAPGSSTTIDGATFINSQGSVVIASGTVTTTEGIGGAIMSGLGYTTGSGGSYAGPQYTGDGSKLRIPGSAFAVLLCVFVII